MKDIVSESVWMPQTNVGCVRRQLHQYAIRVGFYAESTGISPNQSEMRRKYQVSEASKESLLDTNLMRQN